MGNVSQYVDIFFEELEMYEDKARGHFYKPFLHQAILAFLHNENKTTAFEVYKTFFSSYRIAVGEGGNAFSDLLDTLKSYEENAATLIKKQRDHYVHSVNVFILGLCIYARNAAYREAFDQAVLDKKRYPYSYGTRHEEFFCRWGLASLFHDVGYPVEIIGRQAEQFMNFATDVDGAEEKVKAYLAYRIFAELNSIVKIANAANFAAPFYKAYPNAASLDPFKPLDLLSAKLASSLGVPLGIAKARLDGFTDVMAECGFIDHGFFSAIIVLKWYGYLIQKCGFRPEYFYYPVLDSASAILMHNFYRNVLTKAPFSLPPLSAETHPVAYLLILCDELQERNREAYGFVDKKRTLAGEASMRIGTGFSATYLTQKGTLGETFAAEKEALLRELLDLDEIFTDGFYIGAESVEALRGISNKRLSAAAAPRPLLENLERLAIAIHDRYNEAERLSHPGVPLKYPRFSDLPDDLKYSNLRQAQGIADKLQYLGMYVMPKDWKGNRVSEIPEEGVEALAKKEHDDWMLERAENGWVYGPEKDAAYKISPYMLPYEELDEETKDKDRSAVRNIPMLLDLVAWRPTCGNNRTRRAAGNRKDIWFPWYTSKNSRFLTMRRSTPSRTQSARRTAATSTTATPACCSRRRV